MAAFKLKKILNNPKAITLGGTALGGLLGGLLAEYEKAADYYNNEKIKDVASLTGIGGGALAGLLLSNPKFRANKALNAIALGDIASLLGPKQIALQGIDTAENAGKSISEYTGIQNELADKNVDISKNQLATAITNRDIASAANDLSKKWIDISKIALPAIGGLASILTGLYAYNSLKDKKQPISLRINNKLPEREKGSMYLEIPSNKISDKFYNQFSRELLFKDDKEKYLEAKEKERNGMSLTRKEKNILRKFEKLAAASLKDGKNEPLNKYISFNNLSGMQDYYNASLAAKNMNNKFREKLDAPYENSHKENLDLFKLRSKNSLSKYRDPDIAYKEEGDYGLLKFLNSPENAHMDPRERELLISSIKDKNTSTIVKILNYLLPMAQSMGFIPTKNSNE